MSYKWQKNQSTFLADIDNLPANIKSTFTAQQIEELKVGYLYALFNIAKEEIKAGLTKKIDDIQAGIEARKAKFDAEKGKIIKSKGALSKRDYDAANKADEDNRSKYTGFLNTLDERMGLIDRELEISLKSSAQRVQSGTVTVSPRRPTMGSRRGTVSLDASQAGSVAEQDSSEDLSVKPVPKPRADSVRVTSTSPRSAGGSVEETSEGQERKKAKSGQSPPSSRPATVTLGRTASRSAGGSVEEASEGQERKKAKSGQSPPSSRPGTVTLGRAASQNVSQDDSDDDTSELIIAAKESPSPPRAVNKGAVASPPQEEPRMRAPTPPKTPPPAEAPLSVKTEKDASVTVHDKETTQAKAPPPKEAAPVPVKSATPKKLPTLPVVNEVPRAELGAPVEAVKVAAHRTVAHKSVEATLPASQTPPPVVKAVVKEIPKAVEASGTPLAAVNAASPRTAAPKPVGETPPADQTSVPVVKEAVKNVSKKVKAASSRVAASQPVEVTPPASQTSAPAVKEAVKDVPKKVEAASPRTAAPQRVEVTPLTSQTSAPAVKEVAKEAHKEVKDVSPRAVALQPFTSASSVNPASAPVVKKSVKSMPVSGEAGEAKPVKVAPPKAGKTVQGRTPPPAKAPLPPVVEDEGRGALSSEPAKTAATKAPGHVTIEPIKKPSAPKRNVPFTRGRAITRDDDEDTLFDDVETQTVLREGNDTSHKLAASKKQPLPAPEVVPFVSDALEEDFIEVEDLDAPSARRRLSSSSSSTTTSDEDLYDAADALGRSEALKENANGSSANKVPPTDQDFQADFDFKQLVRSRATSFVKAPKPKDWSSKNFVVIRSIVSSSDDYSVVAAKGIYDDADVKAFEEIIKKLNDGKDDYVSDHYLYDEKHAELRKVMVDLVDYAIVLQNDQFKRDENPDSTHFQQSGQDKINGIVDLLKFLKDPACTPAKAKEHLEGILKAKDTHVLMKNRGPIGLYYVGSFFKGIQNPFFKDATHSLDKKYVNSTVESKLLNLYTTISETLNTSTSG